MLKKYIERSLQYIFMNKHMKFQQLLFSTKKVVHKRKVGPFFLPHSV